MMTAKGVGKFYMTYDDLAQFLELGGGRISAITVEPRDYILRRFCVYVERGDLGISNSGDIIQQIDKENFIYDL
jgi:hypothetical protein